MEWITQALRLYLDLLDLIACLVSICFPDSETERFALDFDWKIHDPFTNDLLY